MAKAWEKQGESVWVLNLDVIVLRCTQGGGRFHITSSHGAPEGPFETVEAAQAYGIRYAAAMIEKTLMGLSELEARPVPFTVGYKQTGCGLLVLQIEPPKPDSDEHKKWTNEDGTVNIAYADAQRSGHINQQRVRLRQILSDIGR